MTGTSTSRCAAFAVALSLLTTCAESSDHGAPVASAWPAESAATAAAPAAAASAKAATDVTRSIDFVRDGARVASLDLATITKSVPVEQWTALDPYYNKLKTYRALPLAAVVRLAFGAGAKLEEQDFVLRARDGYTVPMPGNKVLEPGGYIAIEDVGVPGWEPIGPQQANPGPFYVVWKNPDQQSLDTHPRPWQLASIEIARFESTFPHTAPTGEAEGSAAMRGYRIFREQCILCHAVNREGGRQGPDLNVPQSIVEYRPEAQIRAYIKDPLTFRYSIMPSHPTFSDADLDGLIAYFTAMKTRKHDPGAKAGGH